MLSRSFLNNLHFKNPTRIGQLLTKHWKLHSFIFIHRYNYWRWPSIKGICACPEILVTSWWSLIKPKSLQNALFVDYTIFLHDRCIFITTPSIMTFSAMWNGLVLNDSRKWKKSIVYSGCNCLECLECCACLLEWQQALSAWRDRLPFWLKVRWPLVMHQVFVVIFQVPSKLTWVLTALSFCFQQEPLSR